MKHSPPPTTKRIGRVEQAEAALVRLLAETSKRGFFGAATLSFNVQDGRIQQVRIATEQTLK
ncbi:hypothetical protein [Pseudobythopirellula maris]|nr:hypothetical protein [Pseudobythopirellula maris]